MPISTKAKPIVKGVGCTWPPRISPGIMNVCGFNDQLASKGKPGSDTDVITLNTTIL